MFMGSAIIENKDSGGMDDSGQIVGWYRDGLGVDANSNDGIVSVLPE